MFCPRCGSEYREGFTRCADCEVALVDSSPDAGEGDLSTGGADLVEVLVTRDHGEIALAHAALDAEGILYHAQGEHFRIAGVHPSGVRFLVPEPMEAEARRVLAELNS